MRSLPALPRSLLAFLISTQVVPALAQEAVKTEPATEAGAPVDSKAMSKVVVFGDAVGAKQARANVKITSAASIPGASRTHKFIPSTAGVTVAKSFTIDSAPAAAARRSA